MLGKSEGIGWSNFSMSILHLWYINVCLILSLTITKLIYGVKGVCILAGKPNTWITPLLEVRNTVKKHGAELCWQTSLLLRQFLHCAWYDEIMTISLIMALVQASQLLKNAGLSVLLSESYDFMQKVWNLRGKFLVNSACSHSTSIKCRHRTVPPDSSDSLCIISLHWNLPPITVFFLLFVTFSHGLL